MSLPNDVLGVVRDDQRLRAMSRGADVVLALADDRGAQAIGMHDGAIVAAEGPAFTIRLEDAAWAALLAAAPAAGEQHLLPMLRDGRAALEGDGSPSRSTCSSCGGSSRHCGRAPSPPRRWRGAR